MNTVTLLLEENENKTIIIPYADTQKIIDFCKDSQGDVSRDFYDWYLGEPEYFTKKGMLIVNKEQNYRISFDLTDKDTLKGKYYNSVTGAVISEFEFSRQENITMSDIKVKVTNCDINALKRQKTIPVPSDTFEKLNRIKETIKGMGKSNSPQKLMAIGAGMERSVYLSIIEALSKLFVYNIYSMMYYVANNESEEITHQFIEDKENKEREYYQSTYKYTGYIDISKTKVYKPLVERDPDEPIRDYERHIESWSVKGHYRKTSKGVIWIEPHYKGKGELEQRVYSTASESELNLTPKVFDVIRTKPIIQTQVKPIPKENIKQTVINKTIKEIVISKIKSLWQRLIK